MRGGTYVVALICYYAFIAPGIGIPELVDISGIGLFVYAQLVTFPLIVVPILTELAVSYIPVHLLVPRRLRDTDLGLFFYDPRNLGGFEPIGELLKRSYYSYTASLLLWFLQTHTPVVLADIVDSPYPAPGPIYQVVLSVIWFVGVLTSGYSMFQRRGLMKSKKEERLRTLESELKQAVENPYDATPTNITDRERYENAQEHLEQVRETKTYPTTFTGRQLNGKGPRAACVCHLSTEQSNYRSVTRPTWWRPAFARFESDSDIAPRAADNSFAPTVWRYGPDNRLHDSVDGGSAVTEPLDALAHDGSDVTTVVAGERPAVGRDEYLVHLPQR